MMSSKLWRLLVPNVFIDQEKNLQSIKAGGARASSIDAILLITKVSLALFLTKKSRTAIGQQSTPRSKWFPQIPSKSALYWTYNIVASPQSSVLYIKCLHYIASQNSILNL